MALVCYLAGVACAELSMYGTYLAVEMARGGGGALSRIFSYKASLNKSHLIFQGT